MFSYFPRGPIEIRSSLSELYTYLPALFSTYSFEVERLNNRKSVLFFNKHVVYITQGDSKYYTYRG